MTNDSPDDKRTKVTFYADPDVKAWLDSLESGLKSLTINEILREHAETKPKIDERLGLIEGRLRRLEKDTHFDGVAIAALRRVLLYSHGERFAQDFKKEYDDIYFATPRPPRD